MDTTERKKKRKKKGDVIITRGDTVTNSGRWEEWRGEKKRSERQKRQRRREAAQTHGGFKLNRKRAVININCTEEGRNAV